MLLAGLAVDVSLIINNPIPKICFNKDFIAIPFDKANAS